MNKFVPSCILVGAIVVGMSEGCATSKNIELSLVSKDLKLTQQMLHFEYF